MAQPDPMRRQAILALVMVNLFWGISFPAMKATNMIMEEHVTRGSDPLWLATETVRMCESASFLTIVRFAISLVLLAVFVPRLFLGMTKSQWLMGVWTGLAFAPGFLLQNVALNFVPASRSGFLTSLSVVFTPMLMIAVERRLPRWAVVAGVATALVGTAVLTGLVEIGSPLGLRVAAGALGSIGIGDWLTVLAAFIFAIQIIAIDHFSRRMPAGQLTPGMFVATLAVAVVVFGVGHAMAPPARGIAAWGGLLVDGSFLSLTLTMSVFCTVLAFYWMNKYQGHVTPAQAAIIYTLEPIFATLWAMILPDVISPILGLDYASERPGWELVIGGALVVAGNALALWPVKKTE